MSTPCFNLWAAGCKHWDAGWSCVFLPRRLAEMCPSHTRPTLFLACRQYNSLMAAWQIAVSAQHCVFSFSC